MKAKRQRIKPAFVPDPLAELRERYPPVARDKEGRYVIFGTPQRELVNRFKKPKWPVPPVTDSKLTKKQRQQISALVARMKVT